MAQAFLTPDKRDHNLNTLKMYFYYIFPRNPKRDLQGYIWATYEASTNKMDGCFQQQVRHLTSIPIALRSCIQFSTEEVREKILTWQCRRLVQDDNLTFPLYLRRERSRTVWE